MKKYKFEFSRGLQLSPGKCSHQNPKKKKGKISDVNFARFLTVFCENFDDILAHETPHIASLQHVCRTQFENSIQPRWLVLVAKFSLPHTSLIIPARGYKCYFLLLVCVSRCRSSQRYSARILIFVFVYTKPIWFVMSICNLMASSSSPGFLTGGQTGP